jgi:hypothetical protein
VDVDVSGDGAVVVGVVSPAGGSVAEGGAVVGGRGVDWVGGVKAGGSVVGGGGVVGGGVSAIFSRRSSSALDASASFNCAAVTAAWASVTARSAAWQVLTAVLTPLGSVPGSWPTAAHTILADARAAAALSPAPSTRFCAVTTACSAAATSGVTALVTAASSVAVTGPVQAAVWLVVGAGTPWPFRALCSVRFAWSSAACCWWRVAVSVDVSRAARA